MADRTHIDMHTRRQRRGVITMIAVGIALHLAGIGALVATRSVLALLLIFLSTALIFVGMIYHSGPDDEHNVTHHEAGGGPRTAGPRAAWSSP